MTSVPHPLKRPRRLRATPALRTLVRENRINPQKLILPLFIKAGLREKQAIASMPGHYQLSLQDLPAEAKAISRLGIGAVILFGIPQTKDATGSAAWTDDGVVQQAVPILKAHAPDLLVISDLCCCQYTSHGHCGVLEETAHGPDVDNDRTLELLQKQAQSHARAGVDMLAPSGMTDGMVLAIRSALDSCGYRHLPVMSYAVKYASALYGPFRQAAEGAPAFGDRRTYQMDYANSNEALREARLDIEEGADMLMVKPGLTYLDIILRLKQTFPDIPVGAYHPSGECAMIKAAALKGWLDEKQAVTEVLTALHRAGADFIITCYAREFCAWQLC